jgi:hypothetical protein
MCFTYNHRHELDSLILFDTMKSGTVISIEEKQQFLDQSQTYIIPKNWLY